MPYTPLNAGQAEGDAKSSPEQLTDALTAAFKKMDEELLQWLESKFCIFVYFQTLFLEAQTQRHKN